MRQEEEERLRLEEEERLRQEEVFQKTYTNTLRYFLLISKLRYHLLLLTPPHSLPASALRKSDCAKKKRIALLPKKRVRRRKREWRLLR